MSAKLFVVSGSSGAGKTTVVTAALKELQKNYPIKRVVTYTTRSARPGEVNGVHYHFITTDEFQEKIEEGFFLEWSNWYDSYYGSPKSILDDIKAGTSFIVILDQVGAKEVSTQYPQSILIWIQPSSLVELKRRLELRGKNSTEEIKSRLQKAEIEIKKVHQEKLYRHIIKNDELKTAVLDITSLIQKEITFES